MVDVECRLEDSSGEKIKTILDVKMSGHIDRLGKTFIQKVEHKIKKALKSKYTLNSFDLESHMLDSNTICGLGLVQNNSGITFGLLCVISRSENEIFKTSKTRKKKNTRKA